VCLQWSIWLEYLDWNGEYCGFADTCVKIQYFLGYYHVVSLPVYPLCYNPAADDIKARVTRRGRAFESLRGYHFQTSVGRKIILETEKSEERPVYRHRIPSSRLRGVQMCLRTDG